MQSLIKIKAEPHLSCSPLRRLGMWCWCMMSQYCTTRPWMAAMASTS